MHTTPNRNEGRRIVVLITQVENLISQAGIDSSMYDPVRIAHCMDKHGSKIQATWRETEAIHQIPAPGDLWTAINYGYHWILDKRMDTDAESRQKAALAPGDTHLRAPGSLLLNAGHVGYTTYDSFVMDGLLTTATLSAAPVHPNTVQVFLATGAIIVPSAWTLAGAVVTFNVAPTAQTIYIYYQRT